jgi:FMN phosphatase YigB (HAD superfamily)
MTFAPTDDLHPDVAARLAGIAIDPGRPIVVCDADEVVFDFMTGFEAYLEANGLYFTWETYRLNGNLRRRLDDAPIAVEDVRRTVETFFAGYTETLEPVAGAGAALARLARRAQVVILSNVPADCAEARQRALDRHRMPYALIANLGAKGPAVRELAARAAAPAFFIDDSPSHHADVARLAGHVVRVHFVGHARLARLIGPAPDSHIRAETWPEIVAAIERNLDVRVA